jgi:hypothetical protein
MRHQLISHLFRQLRIEAATDIDPRQFAVFAVVVDLKFSTLEIEVGCLGLRL